MRECTQKRGRVLLQKQSKENQAAFHEKFFRYFLLPDRTAVFTATQQARGELSPSIRVH